MRFGLFGGARTKRSIGPEDSQGYESFIEYVVEADRLGFAQMFIDCARMLQGFFDGFFCHFVIGYAFYLFFRHSAPQLFISQQFLQVPCNCLALTVGVGCDEYLVSLGRFSPYVGDDVAFLGHYLIMRHESAFDVDCFFV